MSHVITVSQFLTPFTKLFGLVMNFGGTANQNEDKKTLNNGSMTSLARGEGGEGGEEGEGEEGGEGVRYSPPPTRKSDS